LLEAELRVVIFGDREAPRETEEEAVLLSLPEPRAERLRVAEAVGVVLALGLALTVRSPEEVARADAVNVPGTVEALAWRLPMAEREPLRETSGDAETVESKEFVALKEALWELLPLRVGVPETVEEAEGSLESEALKVGLGLAVPEESGLRVATARAVTVSAGVGVVVRVRGALREGTLEALKEPLEVEDREATEAEPVREARGDLEAVSTGDCEEERVPEMEPVPEARTERDKVPVTLGEREREPRPEPELVRVGELLLLAERCPESVAVAQALLLSLTEAMEREGVRLLSEVPEALGERVGDLVLDAEPETEVERRKLLLMRAVALEHRETRGLPVALLLLLTEEEGVARGVEEAHRRGDLVGETLRALE
jgi:hypothetical protein